MRLLGLAGCIGSGRADDRTDRGGRKGERKKERDGASERAVGVSRPLAVRSFVRGPRTLYDG